MRILVVVGRFPVPSETFVLDQAIGLLARGHDVTVLPLGEEPDASVGHPRRQDLHRITILAPRSTGRRIRHLPGTIKDLWRFRPSSCLASFNVLRHGRQSWSLCLSHWAATLVRARPEFDVALCHFGPNGLTALRLREMGVLSCPIVTCFHGWDLSSYLSSPNPNSYDTLFRAGTAFLPVSEHWAARLRQLGCPPYRIVVHHMGVDTTTLQFAPRTLQPDEQLRLLSIARLVEKKGISYALQALRIIIDSGRVRSVEYRIVGDGPLTTWLQAQAEELGIARHVTFLGHRPHGEVLDELRHAHILLAPSVTAATGDQEGVPVAILEAMASGVLVAATRHSGIPEAIESGKSGLLVDERDAASLAHAVLSAVAAPSRWHGMVIAARRTAEAAFDSTVQMNQLEILLDDASRGTVRSNAVLSGTSDFHGAH